ncbi:hypothetical protein GGF31_006550 [Allomyces arbusculus]|nr:hypothetical protein GGF31_006550 [Allomyces arbusculus]
MTTTPAPAPSRRSRRKQAPPLSARCLAALPGVVFSHGNLNDKLEFVPAAPVERKGLYQRILREASVADLLLSAAATLAAADADAAAAAAAATAAALMPVSPDSSDTSDSASCRGASAPPDSAPTTTAHQPPHHPATSAATLQDDESVVLTPPMTPLVPPLRDAAGSAAAAQAATAAVVVVNHVAPAAEPPVSSVRAAPRAEYESSDPAASTTVVTATSLPAPSARWPSPLSSPLATSRPALTVVTHHHHHPRFPAAAVHHDEVQMDAVELPPSSPLTSVGSSSLAGLFPTPPQSSDVLLPDLPQVSSPRSDEHAQPRSPNANGGSKRRRPAGSSAADSKRRRSSTDETVSAPPSATASSTSSTDAGSLAAAAAGASASAAAAAAEAAAGTAKPTKPAAKKRRRSPVRSSPPPAATVVIDGQVMYTAQCYSCANDYVTSKPPVVASWAAHARGSSTRHAARRAAAITSAAYNATHAAPAPEATRDEPSSEALCEVCADLFARHGLRCTACYYVPAENVVDDGQVKCERCFGGTYTCEKL